MRGSRIPSANRIINAVPPLNPADMSEANALNLMFLYDNLGTGDYLEDASIRPRHYSQLFAREKATPNLTVEVVAGIGWFAQNSYINFAGGDSPTFTAPASNPRRDILTLRNDGVLYRIAGTEAASPVAPTIPSTDIPLAQIYNVVGQTTIRDNDSQVAGQGYIEYDLRPFVQIAVGSSAMPKIGLVARAQTATASSTFQTVVDFTGAGRLLGIGFLTTAAGAGGAEVRITIDGTANTVGSTGAVDHDIIFKTGSSTTMFEASAVTSAYNKLVQGIFFKSSLKVEVRSVAAGTTTGTVVYEHE